MADAVDLPLVSSTLKTGVTKDVLSLRVTAQITGPLLHRDLHNSTRERVPFALVTIAGSNAPKDLVLLILAVIPTQKPLLPRNLSVALFKIRAKQLPT